MSATPPPPDREQVVRDQLAGLPIECLVPYSEGQRRLLEAAQRRLMDHAFEKSPDNVAAAARTIGITRQALHGWMRRHDYEPPGAGRAR